MNILSREDIIAEALTWIGTPFHHQASRKGIGCDCVGFLRGVMTSLGNAPEDARELDGSEKYLGYSRHPNKTILKEVCDKYLNSIPVSTAQPGDAVLLAYQLWPQHLGILSEKRFGHPYIIHAVGNARPPRVLETRLVIGVKQKLVAAYSFPGVR